MKKNIGNTEKVIRITAGIILIGISIFIPFTSTWFRLVTAAIGGIFFGTGLFSYCPLWKALGLNTSREQQT
ncbi:MAG: DUF2892 domain-containing protein [Desulfobulbaceae bacterium]|nr:DUF2892 domain-containing protein [Desulfobulbaceae bacterium]